MKAIGLRHGRSLEFSWDSEMCEQLKLELKQKWNSCVGEGDSEQKTREERNSALRDGGKAMQSGCYQNHRTFFPLSPFSPYLRLFLLPL